MPGLCARVGVSLVQKVRDQISQQRWRLHADYGHTTALVHYVRLSKPEALDMRYRAHFYAVAGKELRYLQIDKVPECHSVKHGAGQIQSLDASDDAVAGAPG